LIKVKRYIFTVCLLVILILPMFFGLYLEYLTIRKVSWLLVIIAIFSFIILLFLVKIIEVFGYNQEIFSVLSEHDVLFALINKNNKEIIWIFFPIIIITEELMFRYYCIGFLVSSVKLGSLEAVFISSIIFALYHIHIWFRFKNLRIFLIFLVFSFLLGLYTGYLVLYVGLIPCILVHYIVAFFSFYSLYRRYFSINDNKRKNFRFRKE